jgi:hypothetical protein
MLKFPKSYVLVTSVANRGDKAGKDDRRPGQSVNFTIAAPNTILDTIRLGLKEALYSPKPVAGVTVGPGEQEEMALEVDTPVPYCRFDILHPIELNQKIEGYSVTFFGKTDKQNLELDDVTLQKIIIDPMEGGTVKLSGQLILKDVNEKVAGRLGVLVQQHTHIALEPPSAEIDD